MPEVKNCLTRKWEPEWGYAQRSLLDGRPVHFGTCRFQLPATFQTPHLAVNYYPAAVVFKEAKPEKCCAANGGGAIEDCLAHRPKGRDATEAVEVATAKPRKGSGMDSKQYLEMCDRILKTLLPTVSVDDYEAVEDLVAEARRLRTLMTYYCKGKEMNAIPQTATMYACPLCGCSYDTEERAEMCHAHGMKMKEYEKCLPWRWYKLISKQNQEQCKWVFPCKVRVDSYLGATPGWPHQSCHYMNFRIGDTRWNQYSSTESWDIKIETLSLMEGYLQHGLIPHEKLFTPGNDAPDEVRQELGKLKAHISQELNMTLRELPLGEIFAQLHTLRLQEKLASGTNRPGDAGD